MLNRRSVLKIGAATVTGGLVKMPVADRSVEFHRAVFDARYSEGRDFAAALQRAGVVTSAIRGDVATLWYGDLRTHLSDSRLPFVGLTDRTAAFCLEELARDLNMRVIFRADHLTDRGGHVQHAAIGTASLVAATRHLSPGAGFGRDMAWLFSRFDIDEPRDICAQKRTGPFSPKSKTALVSWVIA